MKKEDIASFFSKLSSYLLEDQDSIVKPKELSLNDEVKKAHMELVSAEKYFQSVTDPDLVDHAIYTMEAARRKYIYLLKKAREQGITSRK
ncbi:MAG: YaaL family protein [Thermosediminibacteraceae bacterium]|nr:YaaL family protein [Thermosediminibacteraceae bacterium]